MLLPTLSPREMGARSRTESGMRMAGATRNRSLSIPSGSATLQRVQGDRHRGGDPEVQALVVHCHLVAVAHRPDALAGEDWLPGPGVGEVEVEDEIGRAHV